MADARAVGIDLGTTNSAVAWIDESGRSAMLRNSEGDLLTPSVVLFDDAEILVGKEAKRLAPLHPDRVAEWVKRDMGKPAYSRPVRGQWLPPEVIQACILRKLKADITATLGPQHKAVITVPAYFDEPRRKATADAGEMAGLDVLDIVNEPTAAALGFGELLGYLSPQGKPLGEMVIMVYDLGGGTFDATLLRLAAGEVRTLATDGDVQLGGHDWDTRLADYAAGVFQKTHGRDPREDPASLARLYAAAVEAKHTLSARTRTILRVEHAGRVCDVPIFRQQFEEMTADLLERTAYTSRQLLQAAGLRWSEVARILLVGGSTRMPMVPRMLQELTGRVPDRTVNPDEAVARGAAIYARYLLWLERGPGAAPFRVTNVNAHSLGVEGIEPQTLRKVNIILIPRNTPLPAKATERFMTRTEGQRSIVIQVLEGESSLPGECTAIGRTVIRDLPAGLPKGWPIEVTFEYQRNGRLTVRGVVPGTDRQVVLDLERDAGLSHQGISRWKQAVGEGAGFDALEKMVQEVLNLPAVPGSQPTREGPPGPAPAPDAWEMPVQPLAGSRGSPSAAITVADVSGTSGAVIEAKLAAPSPRAAPASGFHSQPAPLYGPAGGTWGQTEAAAASPSPARKPAPPPLPLGAPLVADARGASPKAGAGPSKLGQHRAEPAVVFEPVDAASGSNGSPRGRFVHVAGVVLSGLLGIAVGYLLIAWLFPDRVPRLW